MPRPTTAVLAALFALAGVAGCDGPSSVPVHPVAGTLLIDGRPVENVQLAFHPVDRAANVHVPVGLTKADGAFHLTTFAADDGAPAGDYIVTVFWKNEAIQVDECECPDPATHDHLCGAYTDATRSPLRATVHPGPNEITLHTALPVSGWNLPRRSAPAKARP